MQCLCGSDSWLIADTPVVVSAEINGVVRSDRGHKLAMLTCSDCGRVELYHIAAVQQALREIE